MGPGSARGGRPSSRRSLRDAGHRVEEGPKKSSLIDELKRRHVVRVALVYIGVAYVIVEAADLVFPRLQLPDWTVTLVIGLAIVGFPLALVLAWAFELTPDGVRPTPPPEPSERVEYQWLTPGAVAALAGLLVLGIAMGWLIRPGAAGAGRLATSTGAGPRGGAIAVLPFANLSANTDSTLHLSDGFHRELVMELHRIGLDVRSRTSVMRFRDAGTPLAEIAAALDVDYVVEGSVTFSGTSARVAADLIDVARDEPLWNDEYDMRLDAADIFGTQASIAARIARELRTELSPEATAELARQPTSDFEAWALTQRGIQLWQAAHDSAGYAASQRTFERAIVLDSTYAAPYVGVQLALTSAAASGIGDPVVANAVARAAGARALELDPNASLDFGVSARALLANSRLWLDWDFEGVGRVVDELEAEGEDIGPLFFYKSAMGDHQGAIDVLSSRVEGAPRVPFFRRNLANRLYDARRYAEAAESARLSVTLSAGPYPEGRVTLGQALLRLGDTAAGLDELRGAVEDGGRPEFRAILVWGLGQAGRKDAARRELDALIADVGLEGIPIDVRWQALLGAGDVDGAMAALEAAADARHFIVILLGQDPDADPLRDDPRFEALLDRIGIPPGARVRP